MNAKAWFYSQSFNGRLADEPKQIAQPIKQQKADTTEYCVQCGCYHDRPTWPVEHRTISRSGE